MAGGMDLGTGKGKRRALDAQINLVPFIDLMAVTISFLIMTAVWNQVDRLPVAMTGGVGADSPVGPSLRLPLELEVSDWGLKLHGAGAVLEAPKIEGRYVFCRSAQPEASLTPAQCDEKSLVGLLRRVKVEVPEQRDITVQCEDRVTYRDLVKVIDLCKLEEDGVPVLFPEVAVKAVG